MNTRNLLFMLLTLVRDVVVMYLGARLSPCDVHSSAIDHFEHESGDRVVCYYVAVCIPSSCSASSNADRTVRQISNSIVHKHQPRIVAGLDPDGARVLLASI